MPSPFLEWCYVKTIPSHGWCNWHCFNHIAQTHDHIIPISMGEMTVNHWIMRAPFFLCDTPHIIVISGDDQPGWAHWKTQWLRCKVQSSWAMIDFASTPASPLDSTWFPFGWGYLVIIHFNGIFHETNHLFWGTPMTSWKPLKLGCVLEAQRRYFHGKLHSAGPCCVTRSNRRWTVHIWTTRKSRVWAEGIGWGQEALNHHVQR